MARLDCEYINPHRQTIKKPTDILDMYIGLHGKYFCRTCMVKGSDATDDPLHPIDWPNEAMDNPSPEMSDAGSDGTSKISDMIDQVSPSENPPVKPKKK